MLGIAVLREMARHRLRRVHLIGVPRAALAGRRHRAPGQVGGGGQRVAPTDAPTAFDFLVHQAWVVGGVLGGGPAA